jgi:enoyl-CoA hydratase
MTGREAAEMGWANQAVPEAELGSTVYDVAARMARVPMQLLRLKKDAINSVYDRIGFRETLRASASWNALAHTIPEIDEVSQMMRAGGVKAVQAFYRGSAVPPAVVDVADEAAR